MAAEFLTARAWVVNVIAAGSRPSAVSHPYPESISAEVLAELLVYERCAAWLLSTLSSSGSIDKLPHAAAHVIRAAAARETQSTMHARVDGRELSLVAMQLGVPIVILKGGVRAILGESPAFPIVDIDVLVRPGDVEAVVDELEKSGFGKRRAPLLHHQGFDPAEGRHSVEVHWTTFREGVPVDSALWSRIEPIDGMPGLFSLDRIDNLLHIVHHALANHRQQPVTIRDALLAGLIASECSVQDMSDVRDRLKGYRNEPESLHMISFGEALVTRDESHTNDPFIDECATFYSAVALAPRLPRVISSAPALAFVTEIALGRLGIRYAVKNAVSWRGTGVGRLSRAGDKIPWLARPAIGLAHLAYYGVAAAVTLPLVARTRARALREFGRRSV